MKVITKLIKIFLNIYHYQVWRQEYKLGRWKKFNQLLGLFFKRNHGANNYFHMHTWKYVHQP